MDVSQLVFPPLFQRRKSLLLDGAFSKVFFQRPESFRRVFRPSGLRDPQSRQTAIRKGQEVQECREDPPVLENPAALAGKDLRVGNFSPLLDRLALLVNGPRMGQEPPDGRGGPPPGAPIG